MVGFGEGSGSGSISKCNGSETLILVVPVLAEDRAGGTLHQVVAAHDDVVDADAHVVDAPDIPLISMGGSLRDFHVLGWDVSVDSRYNTVH